MPKPTGLACQPGDLLTGPSWPGRRFRPHASHATRTRPTTDEPIFEDGLQAAALEAELADFCTAGVRWPTSKITDRLCTQTHKSLFFCRH